LCTFIATYITEFCVNLLRLVLLNFVYIYCDLYCWILCTFIATCVTEFCVRLLRLVLLNFVFVCPQVLFLCTD